MSKIVTVIGATGIQGDSVIRALLTDSNYTIRALARNVVSIGAIALKGLGVEVITGDINDIDSLRVAFQGSYPWFKPKEVHTADGSKLFMQMVSVLQPTTLLLLGCEKVNMGRFANTILHHLEKTLPANVVAGFAEEMSWEQMVQCRLEARGIKVKCVGIDKEDYRSLWAVWSKLLNVANGHYEFVGPRGVVSGGEDEDVLDSEELGVQGLVGIAEAFAGMKGLD
ncbi:hypothetical protein G6011_05778 [Alternaria panax]|uniref:NmrA-like domain-containing protein n=1 Tax=Alternaria panax TaxID=48097 RepID=A0AAD4FDM0_9PLEO|nr:hypothetical protein G6011_05778 [Alternaria panax]